MKSTPSPRTVARLRQCGLVAFVLAAVSLTGCNSMLSGRNTTRQIDGSINDSDASTAASGTYSSQGINAGKTDGLSEAKSSAPTHRELNGFVRTQMTPNSPGPFAGTPVGNSNQKVRSTFSLPGPGKLQFQAEPKLRANIDGSGRITVQLAIWALDGTASTSTAIPGSVFTARYTFDEDPADPTMIRFTITHSNGFTASGPMTDDSILMDTMLQLPSFNAGAGDGTAQFELNIEAGGDARFTFGQAESKFDLVKVP
jgi:hypothetical protein